jgi:hypothetical protein
MKNIIKLLIVSMFLWSCEGFDLEDQTIVVEELPGYVSFATAGGTVTPIVNNINEGTTATQNLRIECATGTLSDITVNYSFSGSAVLGTDFEVVSTPGGNATSTGGTIILRNNKSPGGVVDFDFVNLPIRTLRDGVKDGSKQLVITLVSAVNADGVTYVVGRGTYMLSATINIADVD